MFFTFLIACFCSGVLALHFRSSQTTFKTNQPDSTYLELTHQISTTASFSLFNHHSSFHFSFYSSLKRLKRRYSQRYSYRYKPFSIPSLWSTVIDVNDKIYYPVIDTGSSDVILYSKKKFLKNNNDLLDIAYLSKTISVYPQNNTLLLGNVNYKCKIGWTNDTESYILGLGLPELSYLDSSRALTNHIETITLSYKPHYSYIEFNTKSLSDEMLYTNVEGNTYWDVYLYQIFIDHKLLSNKSTTATIDTGTAVLRGPSSQIISILNILENFRNNTNWDCKNVENLPIFYFEVGTPFLIPKDGLTGTITLELEPSYYMREISATCLPAFAISDSNEWIFGEPFLYKFKILLDVKNRRIGFSESYPTRSIVITNSNKTDSTLSITSKTISLLVLSKTTGGAAASAAGVTNVGAGSTVVAAPTTDVPNVKPRTAAPTKGKYASC